MLGKNIKSGVCKTCYNLRPKLHRCKRNMMMTNGRVKCVWHYHVDDVEPSMLSEQGLRHIREEMFIFKKNKPDTF